jgi:hypothetical protein
MRAFFLLIRKEIKMSAFKPRCEFCGSDNVHYTIQTFNDWNVVKQCWQETTSESYAYCDTYEEKAVLINENGEDFECFEFAA